MSGPYRVRPWFHYEGFLGLRVWRWQIDLRDHRKCRPNFSERYGYTKCGRHVGPYCLRVGMLRVYSFLRPEDPS